MKKIRPFFFGVDFSVLERNGKAVKKRYFREKKKLDSSFKNLQKFMTVFKIHPKSTKSDPANFILMLAMVKTIEHKTLSYGEKILRLCFRTRNKAIHFF